MKTRSHRMVVLLALGALVHALPAQASALDSLLHRLPADSLVLPLRRFENESRRPREGAQAALLLGHLHYARGEYRRAAEAFSRAAARLDPANKSEARYWLGLSWLALGDHGQARASLEVVVQAGGPRSVDAQFGMARAWEEARRPERAFEILERLSRDAKGEAVPAILERTITLGQRLQQTSAVAQARRRLVEEFPRSIEAAEAGLTPPKSGGHVVELGPFSSEPRAHTVAEQARHGGFEGAHAVVRGTGAERSFWVLIGEFDKLPDARIAADRAHRDFDVPARIQEAP